MNSKRSLQTDAKAVLIGIPSLVLEIGTDLAKSVGGLVYAQTDISQVAELKGAFGEDSGTWTWGRVQTAAFGVSQRFLANLADLGSSQAVKAKLVLTPEGEKKK